MAENSKKTAAKRKKTPASWKPGQCGNPSGRPKDSESWAGVIRTLQDMAPEEIAEMVGGRTTDLGRAFLNMPKGVQMKYLMSLRAMAGFMFEPNGSLWEKIMERAEGKVAQGVDVTSGGEKVIFEVVRATLSNQTASPAPETSAISGQPSEAESNRSG